MKPRLIALVIAGISLLSGNRLDAHHSFAATYFEDKQQTIEGELVEFQFRNPHSFLQIEVKNEKGETVRYAVEWSAAGNLNIQGVTRETLRPGDRVTVVGSPGRNPDDHRLRVIRMTRPSDGWTWGTRPGEKVE